MVFGDSELRDKLAKLEALFERAGTTGERDAAGAAIGRLKDRLKKEQATSEVEFKFSLPDTWSVRLFVAICRKHDVLPLSLSSPAADDSTNSHLSAFSR